MVIEEVLGVLWLVVEVFLEVLVVSDEAVVVL